MNKGFFVTGTDTGVGKTLVSLGLCLSSKGDYWKPIQTGTPTDTDYVKQFLPIEKIHKSAFHFKEPLSPNQSAELENQSIDLDQVHCPSSSFLIAEGIGGVSVPLNRTQTVLDLIKKLKFPAIVVARSTLGTLNHTLLTLEVLKKYHIPIEGIILSGSPHPKNKADIESLGGVPVILELDTLKQITKENLIRAFKNLKLSY